jgi:BioD-like phosphotransacetylase family protein
VLGEIRIQEQEKVTKTKEIMEKEFDFTKLLAELKLR